MTGEKVSTGPVVFRVWTIIKGSKSQNLYYNFVRTGMNRQEQLRELLNTGKVVGGVQLITRFVDVNGERVLSDIREKPVSLHVNILGSIEEPQETFVWPDGTTSR